MEFIKLIGIVIVIAGFALKLDSILIIFLAAVSTALVSGLGVGGLLEQLGVNFVANRSMAIFIMILLITGVLERNGLREAAADLMRKVKTVSYTHLRCRRLNRCRSRWSRRSSPREQTPYPCPR